MRTGAIKYAAVTWERTQVKFVVTRKLEIQIVKFCHLCRKAAVFDLKNNFRKNCYHWLKLEFSPLKFPSICSYLMAQVNFTCHGQLGNHYFQTRINDKYIQHNENGECHIDGLVQYCIISIANALEILQSCTKPSIYILQFYIHCIDDSVQDWYLQWINTRDTTVLY